MLGLYLPPELKTLLPFHPPHTIISVPVQIAVCQYRARGALMLVAVQLLVLGLYLPPVFKTPMPLYPPQTTI